MTTLGSRPAPLTYPSDTCAVVTCWISYKGSQRKYGGTRGPQESVQDLELKTVCHIVGEIGQLLNQVVLQVYKREADFRNILMAFRDKQNVRLWFLPEP